MKVRWIENLQR